MRLRLLIAALMLAVALLLLPQFLADYAQDYAAAHASWRGLDPNGRTAALLAECCPDIAPSYGGMQTAHPPLATLLALPFAALPWPAARIAWLLTAWAAILAAWLLLRADPLTCAATAPLWVIALGLGTHEPLLFLLFALVLRYDTLQAPASRPNTIAEPRNHGTSEQHQPSNVPRLVWLQGNDSGRYSVGVLVGLAAALKVYPIVLIAGLLIAGRRAQATIALATGAAVLMLCELVLGFGATLGWLRFQPINTQFYIDSIDNGSLVRLVRAVLPSAPVALVAAGILVLFALPLLPRIRSGDWLRPLVPVMLLGSPLSWRHYMGMLAVDRLGRLEQVALALAGTVALLIGMQMLPADNMAPVVQGPLLLVLLWRWYQASRASSIKQIAKP